jgi:hypothetical protein
MRSVRWCLFGGSIHAVKFGALTYQRATKREHHINEIDCLPIRERIFVGCHRQVEELTL